MIRSVQKLLLLLGACCAIAPPSIGCSGKEYEVAEVDGVLLIDGRPGHKVHIEFIPDVGTLGPASSADTDATGKFTLRLMERSGASTPGAVVGSHKVTLSDQQLSESATGKGVPIRFGSEYTLPSSTPLTQEVDKNRQSITIEVR